MELYGERGFDQTTAAEIAERAGLTERTFFRYFADKREVLFAGTDEAKGLIVGAVAGAPPAAMPLEAVTAGLIAFAGVLDEERGREFARRRQRIIASSDELRERELIKLAAWAEALGDALRTRGVDEKTAQLTGEVGIAVFRTAFGRWVETTRGPTLVKLLVQVLDELSSLAA